MKIDLSHRHLLKHPFYRLWEMGQLPAASLQRYARAYYPHVSAFPRYISALHSQVEDIQLRQELLENLIDEERGTENHPELWLRFCEGVGLDRQEVRACESEKASRDLVEALMNGCRQSVASGLGTLYAYESQIPEIARFKLDALKNFYVQAGDHEKLKFFDVHQIADEYHTQTLEAALERLSPAEKAEAGQAALKAADSLWGFLDAMAA